VPLSRNQSPTASSNNGAHCSYRDADLNSAASAEQVYGRIRHAAKTACGDDGSFVRDLKVRRDIEQCENAAIKNAIAQINAPVLTDL
jgi:UrcA family protein